MKVQILGTAACEGVPAAFCRCETCLKSRAEGGRSIRTRSHILFDDDLMVDFPADAYMHALSRNIRLDRLQYLFFTHSHIDHFYPQEFLNRGGELSAGTIGETLHVYGSAAVCAAFGDAVLLDGDEEERLFKLHVIAPFETFFCGDKTVTALPAVHMRDEPCFIYLIRDGTGAALYATDTAEFGLAICDWLERQGVRLDAAIMDCTRGGLTADAGRHMNAAGNGELKRLLTDRHIADERTRFIATHFSHNGGWTYTQAVAALSALGIETAYDGMRLEIEIARGTVAVSDIY